MKNLVGTLILLLILSFLIFHFTVDKKEKMLIQGQIEREELVISNIIKFVELKLNLADSGEFHQILEKIMEDEDILKLYISSDNNALIDINLENDSTIYQQSYIRKFTKTFSVEDGYMMSLYCEFNERRLNESFSKIKIESGLIAASLFLICLLIITISRLALINSVKSISKSAKNISLGALDKRIPYSGKLLFRDVTEAVNQLAEDLQKANLQIDKLNKELKFQFKDKIGELNYEINKKRQAETLLKQSEEQFRLLFELAPIGMVIFSTYGKILKANNAFCTTLGYSETEILNKKIKHLTHPEDQALDSKRHDKLIEFIKENAYYEKRMIRKDGEIIYVIVEAVVVKNKDGKANHIIEQVIDITERKRVEKELIVAKEKAEESDRLKSAFLAQMSHEIRTPLNVILTAMNLIQDDMKENDDDTKELLDSVSSAGKRLQRTIDLILDISALQSGSYDHEFKDCDLNEELSVLIDEFKTVAEEKELSLSYTNNTNQSIIFADHYSVTQIFENLIANAIKYTLKGGVEVILEDWSEDKVQVHVKDTGIGISKEYIAKLFSPFSQEDIGLKREFDGNGLGLALVKNYVEINKAEILVESEKDKGSVFTVIFNRKPVNENQPTKQNSISASSFKELA